MPFFFDVDVDVDEGEDDVRGTHTKPHKTVREKMWTRMQVSMLMFIRGGGFMVLWTLIKGDVDVHPKGDHHHDGVVQFEKYSRLFFEHYRENLHGSCARMTRTY